MKQVLIKGGRAVVEEVPAPLVKPGSILVKVARSCISVGTEMSSITSSDTPLWRRALKNPEKVVKVLELVGSRGLSHTHSMLKGEMSFGHPTGYSAAGIVLEVGKGIEDIRPGNRVACAGAQCAHHAEIICAPRNLSVKIPDNLDFASASTVTLGAIALQGVRRARPTLGETFVVIGLGALGQLTAQILRANGCRVIGTDLDEERVRIAERLGMDRGISPEDGSNIEHVSRLTDGVGSDGVIITAATSSHEVVSTAFRMCRKKGRVILVGDVGLNLNRADFYEKELDFFISTSYGPGRYETNYEEKGLDYPVSYVRWTENRNMGEYLRLIDEGKVSIEPLIAQTYPVEQALEAYEALKREEQKPLMIVLSYEDRDEGKTPARTIPNPAARAASEGRVRIAVVGAGGFAKSMHLPNLQALSSHYHIQAIVSRMGYNAQTTAKQFGANYAGTDYEEVLEDSKVDALLITTRHNLHASMVMKALMAGKHVFVEKPLALSQEELDEITAFFRVRGQGPVLMTGFNRRFSPYARRTKEITAGRSNPMILNYRMNAGYIPLDHWVHAEEGGGRNIGEACHIYDLFTYLTGAKIACIHAQAITPRASHYSHRDNFVATMTFADGSVATLTYTAMGSKEYAKETMEVYVDGKVLVVDDYCTLSIYGTRLKGFQTQFVNKGHKEELLAFAGAIQTGGNWPITMWEQVQAMEIAFEAERQLSR